MLHTAHNTHSTQLVTSHHITPHHLFGLPFGGHGVCFRPSRRGRRRFGRDVSEGRREEARTVPVCVCVCLFFSFFYTCLWLCVLLCVQRCVFVFSGICVVFGHVAGTACAEYMLGDRVKYRRANRPCSLLIAGADQLYQEKANDLWNRQRVLLDPI